MKKILIATRRQGKLDEFKDIFKDLNLKFVTLTDIDFPKREPKENGSTFKANATTKARFYGDKSNLVTLADDSGLEVFALPHKLGIRSKRYAAGSDKDRNQKLLREMRKIPLDKRGARFVYAICLYDPATHKTDTAVGMCYGKIASRAKGQHGFGYDPIFIVRTVNKHFA